MNTKPTLFLILFFSGQLFLSCQKRENTAATPEAVESKKSVLFSDTYHPPLFSNTDRLENLKNALPEVEEIYRKYAIENHYPGIVYGIVLDGELVFSGGEGVINLEDHTPVTERSLFRIASMTKSFTAMAIMKLLEVGKLQLSDPASKYIPELDSVRYLTRDATPVTVYNLLTMSAGFPEDNPWGDRQLDDTDEELLALIKDGISFSNIPSQEYEYSNLGYAILGHIVSRVSGMPYQQYITRNILAPLDMENTRWEYAEVPDSLLALGYRWEENTWKPEPLLHDGSFGAMGGLITSIEDFSKYVAFHLSAWPPRNDPDEGPVKRNSLRKMQTMNFPDINANSKDAQGLPCPSAYGYGYGLRITKDCQGLVSAGHSGGLPGFGSNYVFYPECGIGIMSFDNRTYGGTSGVNGMVADLLNRKGLLTPRELPVSDILKERKEQLVTLLNTRDEKLEKEILAENFYLDKSRELRVAAVKDVLKKAGEIKSIGPLVPQNQLRGTFRMMGEKGDIVVFFTLTPERDPKVQRVDVWFEN